MITIRLLLVSLLLAVHVVASPTTLRVVTWNLHWFPGGRIGSTPAEKTAQILQVREEIRKLNPDILLLQEVGSKGALEETLEPLGPEWKVAVVSRFKQGNFISGQQVAIAARMPAEAVWSEAWKKGWAGAPRGYAYALYKVNGKLLSVYTLHLKSNLGEPKKNTSKREDAVEQLLAHINSDQERVVAADAIIVGGDFNTDDPDTPASQSPGERTFGLLRKASFHWAFEGIAHDARITCPGRGRYLDACFDHFFTKGLQQPLSKVAVDARGSDHRPVVMEIEVK